MRTMKIASLAALVMLAVPHLWAAQAPDISRAPKVIQELSASIQGKSPSEVRAIVIKRFGPAQRDVGRGSHIEQWDIADGVLELHQLAAPTFFDPKAKITFHLLPTATPVRANLLQRYEMTTLPDPANHGNRSWIGNVDLGADMTYRFVDSESNRNERSDQGENFFILYPKGKFKVRYADSITADALLESMAEGAVIAHLVFTSSDGKHKATFFVKIYEQDRRLEFGAEKPLSFCLEAGWKSDGR